MLDGDCLCNKNQNNAQIYINLLNAELNPVCHLLALVGTHHILPFANIGRNSPYSPR